MTQDEVIQSVPAPTDAEAIYKKFLEQKARQFVSNARANAKPEAVAKRKEAAARAAAKRKEEEQLLRNSGLWERLVAEAKEAAKARLAGNTVTTNEPDANIL